MGRTTTPTYRVEPGRAMHAGRLVGLTWLTWDTRDGSPTDDNLARYIGNVERANDLSIGSARIVRQSTGQTVATYRAPLFSVVQEA